MLDFWRAKIMKNIYNADLSVRNDIEGTQSLVISHKDIGSALLRRWGSLVALIFQKTALLGHFMLKWSVKVFFFGPDSDPCLPLSLSVRQPCWNFFSVIVVGFVKRNTWISLSCYIYGFIYSYWYTYTPSTNGWSSSLLVDTRMAYFCNPLSCQNFISVLKSVYSFASCLKIKLAKSTQPYDNICM